MLQTVWMVHLHSSWIALQNFFYFFSVAVVEGRPESPDCSSYSTEVRPFLERKKPLRCLHSTECITTSCLFKYFIGIHYGHPKFEGKLDADKLLLLVPDFSKKIAAPHKHDVQKVHKTKECLHSVVPLDTGIHSACSTDK